MRQYITQTCSEKKKLKAFLGCSIDLSVIGTNIPRYLGRQAHEDYTNSQNKLHIVQAMAKWSAIVFVVND